MSLGDSLPIFAEHTSPDVTIGSYVRPGTEELLAFRREAFVLEPNRDNENQTNVYHPNGTSHTLDIRPNQYQLSVPSWPIVREFFQAIQKWEGYVVAVGQDTFRALLIPIKGEGPDQEAEVYIEEVAQDDRALIEPGAVFYWSIGYLDRPSGRARASVIRFRRLPVWTKHELGNAKREAHRLRGLLDVD
jgi:hypothetical protein